MREVNVQNVNKDLLSLMESAVYQWDKTLIVLNKINKANVPNVELSMNLPMEIVSPLAKTHSVNKALVNVELENAFSVEMDTSLITMEYVSKSDKTVSNTAFLQEAAPSVQIDLS